jgi:hypothetical protein
MNGRGEPQLFYPVSGQTAFLKQYRLSLSLQIFVDFLIQFVMIDASNLDSSS